MLCDNCKENDAVATITRIIKGEVKTERLCERCAAAQGVDTPSSTAKNPLTTFLKAVHDQAESQAGDAIRCSFCSMTLRDFRTTGRLGCALCYGSFERNLRELLRRVQNGTSRHVGKQYQAPEEQEDTRVGTLLELRDRLRRAVETEQFELAASLRDQIRGLE